MVIFYQLNPFLAFWEMGPDSCTQSSGSEEHSQKLRYAHVEFNWNL